MCVSLEMRPLARPGIFICSCLLGWLGGTPSTVFFASFLESMESTLMAFFPLFLLPLASHCLDQLRQFLVLLLLLLLMRALLWLFLPLLDLLALRPIVLLLHRLFLPLPRFLIRLLALLWWLLLQLAWLCVVLLRLFLPLSCFGYFFIDWIVRWLGEIANDHWSGGRGRGNSNEKSDFGLL
ncbi:hypothetical protein HOY82DRAFT_575076 [Tuber indicum]|nr:hypothetical protein HOY82DRAFT_575076 [Tuber indicum]